MPSHLRSVLVRTPKPRTLKSALPPVYPTEVWMLVCMLRLGKAEVDSRPARHDPFPTACAPRSGLFSRYAPEDTPNTGSRVCEALSSEVGSIDLVSIPNYLIRGSLVKTTQGPLPY